MKKIILFLLIAWFGTSCHTSKTVSNPETLLTSEKWKVADVTLPANISSGSDKTKLKSLIDGFKESVNVTFKSDHTYIFVMSGGSNSGTWKVTGQGDIEVT